MIRLATMTCKCRVREVLTYSDRVGHYIGRRLREMREERSLTQKQAAFEIGVHQPHVSKIEIADHDINIVTLLRFLEAYGGDIRTFFADAPIRQESH